GARASAATNASPSASSLGAARGHAWCESRLAAWCGSPPPLPPAPLPRGEGGGTWTRPPASSPPRGPGSRGGTQCDAAQVHDGAARLRLRPHRQLVAARCLQADGADGPRHEALEVPRLLDRQRQRLAGDAHLDLGATAPLAAALQQLDLE